MRLKQVEQTMANVRMISAFGPWNGPSGSHAEQGAVGRRHRLRTLVPMVAMNERTAFVNEAG
jgi:hypothetical protein